MVPEVTLNERIFSISKRRRDDRRPCRLRAGHRPGAGDAFRRAGDVSPFLCGAIALSLLYAAYASQTLRGALKAVPQGQWESGQALGLSKAAIFFRLVMPQMWRHALPGLGNQWLVLLKDTALVSLISVNDLMLQTKSIATRTQEPFNWYIIAAAIYLVITLLSQYILKRIDQRATRFERRPG